MGTFPAAWTAQKVENPGRKLTLMRNADAPEGWCANYTILFNSCAIADPPQNSGTIPAPPGVVKFSAQVEMWPPIEYERETTEEVNARGEVVVSNTTVRRRFSFDAITDDYNLDQLYQNIVENPHTYLHPGTSLVVPKYYKIYDVDIERLSDEHDEALHIRVSFYADDYKAFTSEVCCASEWEEGGIEGGGIEIRDPEGSCDDYEVSLDNIDDTLYLNVSGTFDLLSYTSSWKRDGNDIGTNIDSYDMTGLYGLYEVSVWVDGCNFLLSYDYIDPCDMFAVIVSLAGDVLTALPSSGGSGNIFAWEFSEDGATWAPVGADSNTHVVTDAGYYRVTVTTEAGCEASAIAHYDAAICDLSITITADDEFYLSATVTPFNDAYTYVWTLDTGDGPVEIGNNIEQQATETGLYELTVTLADPGCEVTGRKVVIIPEDGAVCCTLEGIVNKVGDDLVISFAGCEDPAFITWFKNSGNGFVQVGSGDTITLTGNGLYRAHVRCGDCEMDRDYLEFECSEDQNCDLTLTLTNEGDTFTVNVEGCPSEYKIAWTRIDENGETYLYIFSNSITPTEPGLYKATVHCGDCIEEIAFMAYECEDCLEVNYGEPEPVTVCN